MSDDDRAGSRLSVGFLVTARLVVLIPIHARISSSYSLFVTGIVAASEIGDKTMLMAICLAARFRRSVPIIWGILVATILNHGLAGGVGATLAYLISDDILRWVLIVSFAAMAVWMLIPDKLDDDEGMSTKFQRFGVFGTTVVLFFLAEMGDK